MLAQRAASIATCTPSTPTTMTNSQILVRTLLAPLGDGSSKLSFDKDCNPSFVEGKRKETAEGHECDGFMERGGGATEVKQAGSENVLETPCREKPGEREEAEQSADEGNHPVKPAVDACLTQIDKLSLNVQQVQKPHVGQGELSPTDKDMRRAGPSMQTVSPTSNDDVCAELPMQTVSPTSNDDVSNLLDEKSSKEQGEDTPLPRKTAVWRAPEPKPRIVKEPEFVMEASSWPTLAEARHAKPSEGRSSPAHKETTPIASAGAAAAQKVPSSQENSMEPPKQLNTNHSHPGPKYRSPHRKGGSTGYGRPNFPATENIPVPPMGVHVPNANAYNPGIGRGGINNFFPGPYQVPANGPFYHHNGGEGLASFQHNSVGMPPYGSGFPAWQYHGRGHSGLPAYDQQQFGPRYMQPPNPPYMNFSAAHYNHPRVPGEMSYRPAVYGPPVYNYAGLPYGGPFQAPRAANHGWEPSTIYESVQHQIEYYFSKENLIKDIYLTSKMDEEGFVPLALIAGFPRVECLTKDFRIILEALRNSSVVEVKNGKFLRSLQWRRQPVATSRANSAENGESFVPSSDRIVDHTREHTSDILREPVSEVSAQL